MRLKAGEIVGWKGARHVYRLHAPRPVLIKCGCQGMPVLPLEHTSQCTLELGMHMARVHCMEPQTHKGWISCQIRCCGATWGTWFKQALSKHTVMCPVTGHIRPRHAQDSCCQACVLAPNPTTCLAVLGHVQTSLRHTMAAAPGPGGALIHLIVWVQGVGPWVPPPHGDFEGSAAKGHGSKNTSGNVWVQAAFLTGRWREAPVLGCIPLLPDNMVTPNPSQACWLGSWECHASTGSLFPQHVSSPCQAACPQLASPAPCLVRTAEERVLVEHHAGAAPPAAHHSTCTAPGARGSAVALPCCRPTGCYAKNSHGESKQSQSNTAWPQGASTAHHLVREAGS